MSEREERSTGLLHASDELRKLLSENPGLPLLVFAGQYFCRDQVSACSKIDAYKGEYLDCEHIEVYEEEDYIDKAKFEEDLYDSLYEHFDGTDEEFEDFFKKKLKKYESYWKPAIIVFVE